MSVLTFTTTHSSIKNQLIPSIVSSNYRFVQFILFFLRVSELFYVRSNREKELVSNLANEDVKKANKLSQNKVQLIPRKRERGKLAIMITITLFPCPETCYAFVAHITACINYKDAR